MENESASRNRPLTLSESLTVLRARLSGYLSPAEKDELDQAIVALSERGQIELGWLVENGQRTMYRTMENGYPEWTPDHNKAIRFARRKDAEDFCKEDEDAWHVAEHQWG